MTLFLFIAPSPVQVIVVLVLGVLFFGKNLPEVAKRVGVSLLEFKKGLNDLKDVTKDVTASFSDDGESLEVERAKQEETEKYETFGSKFVPPGTLG